MSSVLLPLVPTGAFVLVAFAVRPRVVVHGPIRLALVRTAIIVGCAAVGSVEALSALGWLDFTGILLFWLGALALAGAGAWWRWRADRAQDQNRADQAREQPDVGLRLRSRWAALDRSSG